LNADEPFSGFISLINNATTDPCLQVGRTLGHTLLLLNSATNVASFKSGLMVLNLNNAATTAQFTAYDNDTGAVLATKSGVALPANGFYFNEDVLADMGITGKFCSVQIESLTLGPIQAYSLVKSIFNNAGFLEAVPIQ
jgi:hypothetical protein